LGLLGVFIEIEIVHLIAVDGPILSNLVSPCTLSATPLAGEKTSKMGKLFLNGS